ncbi:AAA family ATPase [Roseicyclus sp. F158]|uniref:AAA family ATPase n=1 Tax=Tropicimonas omnivorans TaxID=3075590 RepID=A0ABU3DFM3_9RHOB|nr:AAA family ATPase [Roseicyclus sp. F158]MDT0682364.1 AAA family ATPase [Roseicyclus sp. F158]
MTTSSAALQPEPAPISACTISRDVQNFDLLIEDMETELGENWGDLSLGDGLTFLGQPDAGSLEFVVVAIDDQDEESETLVGDVIRAARRRDIAVLLVAKDVRPTALHQLLRLGAREFLPYPLPENALHEAIDRIRTPEPQHTEPAGPDAAAAAPRAGKGDRDGAILAVHGLAGGVGATTFAVNLAWELAGQGRKKEEPPKVCVIDLDLQYGSVSTALDLQRRDVVYEMLADTGSMDAEVFHGALQTHSEKLHVLTAPPDILPLDLVAPEDIAAVLDMARAHFDFVVVDMPSTLVAWSETVLQAADVYFALIELDMRSAQNTLRFNRLLKGEDLPTERIRYGLNRAPKFTDLQGKSRARRLAESLDITIELQLPDGGRQVTQCNDQGETLAEGARKSPLRKEILKLATSLHDIARVRAES